MLLLAGTSCLGRIADWRSAGLEAILEAMSVSMQALCVGGSRLREPHGFRPVQAALGKRIS